jgi:hypothetical protein
VLAADCTRGKEAKRARRAWEAGRESRCDIMSAASERRRPRPRATAGPRRAERKVDRSRIAGARPHDFDTTPRSPARKATIG